jgi:hypothetical protein
MYVCLCVCLFACLCVCVCMYVCVCVSMYVCVYVCMYVRMYVLYVCTYVLSLHATRSVQKNSAVIPLRTFPGVQDAVFRPVRKAVAQSDSYVK